jgi:purine-cytosine permease-like protein
MNTKEKKPMPVWVSILIFIVIMAAVMIVGMSL